jgi:ATP-dependent phosphofructokinase / diphosphate-dependent phosphofructokinase
MVKKIGILTSGGDSGGLNAAIQTAVKTAHKFGWEAYGIRKGFEGLIRNDMFPLTDQDVDGIQTQTGTILQTSRVNPFDYNGIVGDREFVNEDVSRLLLDNAQEQGLDDIVVLGGNGSLSIVPRLIEAHAPDITFIAIPKTMDGDLQEYSLGLDTAINRSQQVLEDFIPVLKSSGSIGIVELYGRDVGRVAFKSGISAGSDVILIPEIAIDLDHLCNFIANKYNERAKSNTSPYVLITVAEGTANPTTTQKVHHNDSHSTSGPKRLGGIGNVLAHLIYEGLNQDERILSHTSRLDIKVQSPTYDVRGGETMYTDSYVGQKLGAAAIHYLGNSNETGMAIINCTVDGQIETMPITDLIKPSYVHMGSLELFERSGLHYFGRDPGNDIFIPSITRGTGVNVTR